MKPDNGTHGSEKTRNSWWNPRWPFRTVRHHRGLLVRKAKFQRRFKEKGDRVGESSGCDGFPVLRRRKVTRASVGHLLLQNSVVAC